MQINRLYPIAAMLTLAACGSDSSVEPLPTNAAVLTVVFPSHTADTLDVLVTDSTTIAAADAFIHTGTGPHMLTGDIVRGAGIDTTYPFHYKPESVTLAEVAIELCDGAPMRTTQAVDAFFLAETGSATSDHARWCPWESRPIALQRVTVP